MICLRRIQDEERSACHKTETIGQKIKTQNKNFFSKVKEANEHNDKIHENIVEDKIRDNILSGELNREDCDEENVCKFICLLKKKINNKS